MNPSRLYKHPRRFPLSRKARPVLPAMKIEPARAAKLLEKTISVSLHRNELVTVGLFNVEDVKTLLKSAGIEPNIGSHVSEIKLPIQVFKELFEAHGFQNVRAVFVTDPWKGNSFEIKATKPASLARVLPVKIGAKNRAFLMSHNICLPL